MAFEDIMAGIERRLGEIGKRPHDWHELYFDLHEKLNEMRATGMSVPDDLLRLERELEAEFALRSETNPEAKQIP